MKVKFWHFRINTYMSYSSATASFLTRCWVWDDFGSAVLEIEISLCATASRLEFLNGNKSCASFYLPYLTLWKLKMRDNCTAYCQIEACSRSGRILLTAFLNPISCTDSHQLCSELLKNCFWCACNFAAFYYVTFVLYVLALS